MQPVSFTPYVVLAMVLHGMFALWFYKTPPSQPVQLTGKGGAGLSVALDHNTYKNLLSSQQQQTAHAKAAKPPTIEKPLKKASKRVNKPVPTSPVSKKITTKQQLKPNAKRVAIKPMPAKQSAPAKSQGLIAMPVAQVKPQPLQSLQPHKVSHANQAHLVKTAAATPVQNSREPASTGERTIQPITESTSEHASNTPYSALQTNMGAAAPLVMDDHTKQYLRKLMRHLQRYKSYPAELKKAHIEGKPVIRFSINQQGRITDLSTKRSSGNPALDQAAMAVFRQANPLPAIPVALHRDTLTMSLPIEFNLIN